MKSIKWVLFFAIAFGLFSTAIFQPPGLTSPEPIGQFLNNTFPRNNVVQPPYEIAFPNITFNSPLNFNLVPGQNKFVIGQRNGQIYWFENDENTPQKNLLVDLSDEVAIVRDGGFLGLAIHPQFGNAGKNFIYIYYSTKSVTGDTTLEGPPLGLSCGLERFHGNYLHLERFEVNPNNFTFIDGSLVTMFKLQLYNTTHRGGGMEFGDDGFLYLTTGDQSTYKSSQSISDNLDGGVLRLDVDKDPSKSHAPIRTMPADAGESDEFSGIEYWIPNDNPFNNNDGSIFEEYYTLGHRNPHRMTKDRETGTFYIGEIGESKHEEINVVVKGKNYGWPVYEGNAGPSTFCSPNLLNNMPHERPLVEFPRADANAIMGGYVYRGSNIPELYGKYICADFGTGDEIWSVDTTNGNYELLGNFLPTNIISFGQDYDGELYLLKQGENVNLYRLVPTELDVATIPSTLSETGAFSSLEDLTVVDGFIPYELIDPFWSDGALKKRWLAIPNDGTHNTPGERISYSENGDWDFPTGTVIIKHFEFPIDENNPSLTKKIETRFSIKGEDGNFYFLTYNWNDQETEAFLQETGIEEPIQVTTLGGGTKTVQWHFPSNAECIGCHNSTTKGSLGLRTRYLNKDFTYESSGITANQLVTLSHLGIIEQNISDTNTSNFLTHSSIYDTNASLEQRARSYLDLNCAYCHRPGASGDRANFDLRLTNSLDETGLLNAEANTPLGLSPTEKIIDPGNASNSILYHRVNSVDPSIMMPQLAKNEIDIEGVTLLEQWINQLNPNTNTGEPAEIVYRINCGGQTIPSTDSGPNWANDSGQGFFNGTGHSVNTGNLGGTGGISNSVRHFSVPSYIGAELYQNIFASQRWDPGESPEMTYNIPIQNGDYSVNLYVGNDFGGTGEIGDRVFDITIEGLIVESDFDPVSEFGHLVGGMLSYPVTISDGVLNIGFLHIIENPLISGIEVIIPGEVEDPEPDPLVLSAIADRSDVVGATIGFDAQASGGDVSEPLSYVMTGAPSGMGIDSSTGSISGTIATGADTGGPLSDGVYQVTVTASRAGSTDVSTSFEWTVTADDPAPGPLVLSAIADRSDVVGATVGFDAQASGGDVSEPLSYVMTGAPSGMGIDSSTGSISGTIATGADTGGPLNDGVYQVTVTASRTGSTDVSTSFEW
ncbi:PQQ-dependent sugar dehydrogenase, partial [Croceivirga thetidis]